MPFPVVTSDSGTCRARAPLWELWIRDRTQPPLIWCPYFGKSSGTCSATQPKRKSANLEKDRVEVLAKTPKPFEDHCPRMITPWPGQFQRLFSLCWIDAGQATRDSQKRPASHILLSTFVFYTTSAGGE